ncbi:hypothetical protein Pcinc_030617 [Petrolisthes cinctipes]|uniref:Peptidase S1 domain-containing protein n=1 Tax=Petrolisthes cinctipes TaxID=88211 RepID=A0AAE1K629_PETCI|nr:hypothetical protein Pcinc_030617 [Petrolisthes cinctipes]
MRVWLCVCAWLVVCGFAEGQRRRQGGQTPPRLGLLAEQLNVDPVPGGFPNNQPSLPKDCFCLPVNQQCPGNMNHIIDVRIVNTPGIGPCPNEKLCCPKGTDIGVPPVIPGGPVTQRPGPIVPQPVPFGTCGVQNPIPYRNAGFSEATFGEYPWIAVVLTRTDDYLGGGALISNQWVLTAAHKVHNANPRNMKVRLGELDVSTVTDHPQFPHVEVDVAQVIIHPQFDSTNLFNDVALLRLSQPVNTANYPHIGPVCLPEQDQIFHGNRQCWVTGFGQDAFGQAGNFQKILKEVDVPMVDPFVCEERLRRTRLGEAFKLDDRSFVCAGGIAGKDACTGDGGAPLVCRVQNKWYVAGLVAWGIGCAQGDVPGVYVNVPSFVNFIYQNIGQRG